MELKFIYTDSGYKELGYLKNFSIDIENGKYKRSNNDFEITQAIAARDPEFKKGSLFYWPGTDYGGIVKNFKVDTEAETITFKGKTARGMLEKEVIQPPEGQSHLKLRGDANACIAQLIDGRFDGLFEADPEPSGININYDVRDLCLLDALEKALGAANAKLDIKYNDAGKIRLQALKINDLSDSVQYDNNYKVNMIIETQPEPYTHVLALGKGELTARLRVNLYLQEDGTWTEAKEVYKGLARNTYLYENVNAADKTELINGAIEKVKEANKSANLNISFEADNAELFDVVSAKEQITGVEIKETITMKILKGTASGYTSEFEITYEVGD